jgi:hypothetical protein
MNLKGGETMENDGGTNFILRNKEQALRLNLQNSK